jgi:Protein of unknown function (DUF1576)
MTQQNAAAEITPLACSNRRILQIVALFPLAFIVAGMAIDGPGAVWHGLLRIITSRDTLITDYIGLGGIGAAFTNAGLLTLIAIVFYDRSGATIGGAAVACLFLVLGFGLFGKSLLNVWFIVAGVWLYARYKGEPFAKHINTAFFGAALAPIFSEILFSSALPLQTTLPLAVVTTLLLGFVLAPAAAHLFNTHMGHTLYNIGFVAGLLGTLIVAVYKSYGFVPDPVFIWTTGNNALLGPMLLLLFAAAAGGGWLIDRQAVRKVAWILRQPGQAPSDYVAQAGIGPSLVNMGLTGAIGTLYVLLIGSDLNGPTIGAILTIVGFSAYGKHPRNILPVMAGVFIGSLLKDWSADDASAVLAALFGTTLAPIAGRFGWHWGVVAGVIHSSVVQTVGQLHGGLVLYNNGFAAGLVAAILVPVIIALQRPASGSGKDSG